MGFLKTISKPQAPEAVALTSSTPSPAPQAEAKPKPKLPIQDESSSTSYTSAPPAGQPSICGKHQLVQRGIYVMPNGEKRMFLCGTPHGFSFAPLTKGGMPMLLKEGTEVVQVGDVGPDTSPVPVLPPDAPKSDPALASQKDPATQAATVPAAPEAAAVEQANTEKPKRAKKAKEETAPVAVPEKTEAAPSPEGARVRIFVNCMVPGVAGKSLLTYVEALSSKLLKSCGENVLDIRMAHSDALGFGKWKGALAVAAQHSKLEPGDYLVTGDDERIAAVLPELAKFCAPGDFVVGR